MRPDDRPFLPGDVVMRKGADPFGLAITALTKSPYTHCKLLVAPNMVVEAVRPKVRSWHLQDGDEFLHVPYPSLARRAAAVDEARRWIGHPYSISAALSDLAGYAGLPWYFGNRKALNCCELVLRCLHEGFLFEDEPYEGVTPGRIRDLLIPLQPHQGGNRGPH